MESISMIELSKSEDYHEGGSLWDHILFPFIIIKYLLGDFMTGIMTAVMVIGIIGIFIWWLTL